MNYPKAIGPYSIYKEYNGIYFISGQLPVNPSTGDIESEDIREQTKQSLQNIAGILEELGLSFANVLKTSVFLNNMDDFASMNEVYGEFFVKPYPSRSCVAVRQIPKNAKVEIEVIAHK